MLTTKAARKRANALPISEAARELGCHRRQIYRWQEYGDLPTPLTRDALDSFKIKRAEHTVSRGEMADGLDLDPRTVDRRYGEHAFLGMWTPSYRDALVAERESYDADLEEILDDIGDFSTPLETARRLLKGCGVTYRVENLHGRRRYLIRAADKWTVTRRIKDAREFWNEDQIADYVGLTREEFLTLFFYGKVPNASRNRPRRQMEWSLLVIRPWIDLMDEGHEDRAAELQRVAGVSAITQIPNNYRLKARKHIDESEPETGADYRRRRAMHKALRDMGRGVRGQDAEYKSLYGSAADFSDRGR